MENSPGSANQAHTLKRPPSPWIWKGLLAVGVLGRGAAVSQGMDARRLEEAEAVRVAAVETRRVDSIRLAAAVDSGPTLSPERSAQVDWSLHASHFSIPHNALHRRVVGLQIDSTARVVRRALKDATYAAAARQLLTAIEYPLTDAQARRQIQLSNQLDAIDRRHAEAARRQARARAQAEARQQVQPLRRQVRVQPPSNSAPPGASARCQDGSYSYSTSRRGTCSHHGGVSEWL
jgi:uncharacterized membrane protein YqiK